MQDQRSKFTHSELVTSQILGRKKPPAPIVTTHATIHENTIQQQHPNTAKAAPYTQITLKQKQHISTFL